MRLDLNLVEVFCCVTEQGSFSRAAEKLRLSQPTISGHIKSLEDYVGAKLFDRLPRQIILTPAGKLLYRRGRAILDEKQAAIRELEKFLNCIEGSIVMCGSTIPGEYLLPQVIASFHSRFPSVKVDMRILDSQAVCEKVLNAKAEIGFVGARLEAVSLEFRHFASDELALVVPNNEQWRQSESITPEQLLGLPFLARETGSGTRLAFERKIGKSIEEFNVVGCFGSTGAVKEALKVGLGVSVLSLLAVRDEIASGKLKIIKIDGVDPIRRDFYAVVNRNLTLSPVAEAFLDYAFNNASKTNSTAA